MLQKMLPALMLTVFMSANTTALGDASVYVVHGIPGEDVGLDPALPVDISVNGSCTLTDVQFGDIAGALALPAGSYDIAISPANADAPCSEAALISAPGVMLEDDVSYSIVAHLAADGTPAASVLVNETETKPFKSTVNLFHLAAAPSVDVQLKKSSRFRLPPLTIRDLSNGEQASAKVIAGDYTATIFPAGERDPVFGPVDLSLEGETAYLVYAVGSLTNETFTLLVKAVEDMTPATVFVVHGIPGGDVGLAADLPVDIALNGACTLEGFTFGSITDPLEVPAGTYDIDISPANAASPCSEAPLIEADDVELMAGENYSITANLAEDGTPTANVFVNETFTRGPFALVNVFHVAAAPAVDVIFERVNARFAYPRVLADVSNGESGSLYFFEGDFDASIVPTMATDPVFGPIELALEGSTVYLVYAVGSLDSGSFTLLSTAFESDGQP